MSLISVVHRSLERVDDYFSNPFRTQLFGTPLLMRVDMESLTGAQVRDTAQNQRPNANRRRMRPGAELNKSQVVIVYSARTNLPFVTRFLILA